MKTNLKFIAVIAFAVLFGSKAFAQGTQWEYVRTYDANETITPNLMQSLTELESGDIIVNASWRDNYVNGTRSENPGLMKFSSDGVLQKESDLPTMSGNAFYNCIPTQNGELITMSPGEYTLMFYKVTGGETTKKEVLGTGTFTVKE